MPDFHGVDTKKLSLSLVDDLTQLCNRRFIYNNMPKIIAQNKAFAKKTSLFMIDVDNFKKINDTFGHLVGDMILMELAGIMKKSVADSGIVARYAGDEFLILLPGQEEDQAYKIGDAILQNASQFEWSTKDRNFTGQGLSMGIAAYHDDGASITDLINCADQALYAAKRAGKSKIIHYKSVGREIKDHIKLKQMLLRPPLVNRKKEIESLKESYKICETGKKQRVLLHGQPGVGKTRILEELAGWVEKQDNFFLFCKLRNEEEGGPLAALAELIRLAANSLGPEKFAGILAKLTPLEFAEIVCLYPAAKELVKKAPVKADSKNRTSNLFFGLAKIFVNMAAGKTLVLAVDNLHLANQLTLQFFLLLLGMTGVTKFLFVGTSCGENDKILKDFLGKNIFKIMELMPFEKDETAQLLNSILPEFGLKTKLVDDIFKMSKGSPVFICEILKTLVESGRIKYENGQWKAEGVDAKDIPSSLSDTAEPSIAKLDDETKEVLSAAAVMGNKIDFDVLKDFSGYSEGHLLDLLDRAIDAGLLGPQDLTDSSLTFRTDSSRKALAGMVPAEKADLIHRKTIEIIKERYKDELPTQINRLIHHLDLIKERDSALKYKNLSQKLNEEFSLPAKLEDLLNKIEKQKDEQVSIEELMEKPLSEASSKIIKDAILAIRAATIGTLLYPPGNDMRVDLENRAYEFILKILKNDPTMTISDVEDKILVNGYAPKHMDVKNTIGFTLISLMEGYGISSITFKEGLMREEFVYFLHYLSNAEENKEQEELAVLFQNKGITHIKVDQVKYEKLSVLIHKAIGPERTEGEIPPKLELSKQNLLAMPLEQYLDPKISNKLGLIAEALILNKNDEKLKDIVGKFSGDLSAADTEDKFAVTEGAIRLSESLLIYEQSNLLKSLIKALLDRTSYAQQSKEFTQLCGGLQTIAVGLIDKGNFSQAGTIINHFKEQIAADSTRTHKQKEIAKEALLNIAHPKVIEALLGALKEKLRSGDCANITDLLIGLGENAIDSMLGILTKKEFDEKDPFELYVMRHSVAMVLKEIGQPAKDALKKMLTTDKRAYVISNVIEMFGYIGGDDIAPLLTPFLHSDSPQVRIKCLVALKKHGTKESLKILTEDLKSTNERIKQSASLAIAELADKSFVKELKPLLLNRETEDIVRETINRIQAKKGK